MKKLLCVFLVFALCFAVPLRSARAASPGDLRCMISDGQVDILDVGKLYICTKNA